MESEGDIVIVVDSLIDESQISGTPDYAYCNKADDRSMFMQDVKLRYVSEKKNTASGEPSGRWNGMIKVKGEGSTWIKNAMHELKQRENFDQLTIPDLLNFLTEQGKKIHVHYISGHWLDVNSINDINKANDFTAGQSG